MQKGSFISENMDLQNLKSGVRSSTAQKLGEDIKKSKIEKQPYQDLNFEPKNSSFSSRQLEE